MKRLVYQILLENLFNLIEARAIFTLVCLFRATKDPQKVSTLVQFIQKAAIPLLILFSFGCGRWVDEVCCTLHADFIEIANLPGLDEDFKDIDQDGVYTEGAIEEGDDGEMTESYI